VLQCVAVYCSILQWRAAADFVRGRRIAPSSRIDRGDLLCVLQCCSVARGGGSCSWTPYRSIVSVWDSRGGLLCVLQFCSVLQRRAAADLVRGRRVAPSQCLGSVRPRGFAMCVAVCCSVLQCVAVCCCVLQSVAVCCRVLQCVAVCCSALQCVAVCCSVLQCVAVWCRVVQCGAVCCSALQCGAVCCRAGGFLTLQHTATHYKTHFLCGFKCTDLFIHMGHGSFILTWNMTRSYET